MPGASLTRLREVRQVPLTATAISATAAGEPIHPPQVEYEFTIRDVFRLHIGCVGMWLAELRRRGLVKQNGTL